MRVAAFLAVLCASAFSASPLSAQTIDIQQHDSYYSFVRPQPHTYTRHVNISLDAVETRVANGLRCASKFSSLSEANYRINSWMTDWKSIAVDNLVTYGVDYEQRVYHEENLPNYGWTYIGPKSGISSPGWYYANAFTIVIMKVPRTVKWDQYVILTAYPNVKGWCF